MRFPGHETVSIGNRVRINATLNKVIIISILLSLFMTTAIYILPSKSYEKTVRTKYLLVGANRVFGGDMTFSWNETADWSILTEYVNTRALLSKCDAIWWSIENGVDRPTRLKGSVTFVHLPFFQVLGLWTLLNFFYFQTCLWRALYAVLLGHGCFSCLISTMLLPFTDNTFIIYLRPIFLPGDCRSFNSRKNTLICRPIPVDLE